MSKVIVSKGWEGFADRLQCLSYCIDVAVKYNRHLYVDWYDTMWQTGFYTYFDVRGVLRGEPEGTAYPEFWNDALEKPNGDWVYRIKDYVEFQIEDADGDTSVWVHSGVGPRTWSMVTLAKRLQIKCLGDISQIPLPRVVHLRGTDRTPDFKKLRQMAEQYPDAAVLSDDAKCVKEWLTINPEAHVITESLSRNGKAIHQEGLEGWTRHQLNLQVISDFVTLALAKEAHALNDESLFFQMARVYGTFLKNGDKK